MKNGSILIIDDDRDVLAALGILLEDDFAKIVKESNVNRIDTLLAEAFDVVLLDMNFTAGINSGNEGLYWLSRIKKASPSTEVVMMTAYGNISLAVDAIKRGAKDFVLKPWDNAKLLATLKSSLSNKTINGPGLTKNELYVQGTSSAILSIHEQIEKVAATDASVLLLGESGTGKEVYARQIHRLSTRKLQAFCSVDLSVVPAGLFESELFGHKRGAFTDAKNDYSGKFLSADKGTLFLDEIGNLPLAQQVKLLTALQNRWVMPVGSTQSLPFDVRLISATNENLPANVAEGKFRQDLLYRINTITITIPPLRQRVDDIEILAAAFLKEFTLQYNKPEHEFSTAALGLLRQYPWPGNIRELKHTIEKVVILADERLIDVKDLDLSLSGKPASPGIKKLDELEKEAMIDALRSHGGNIVHAAKALGITRQTLYNKMKKYGI